MKARSRRASAAVAATAVAAVAVIGVWGAQGFAAAGDETQLGFFDISADATGIGASFGDPAMSPYPVAAGFAPNASAQLSAGPSGQAQASVMWPGPLLGNAGSLVNVIGTPIDPSLVSNANYPVVARANAAGGGKDEETLGPMHAVVDGNDSTASTALTNVNAPGVISAARVVTKTHSFSNASDAVAIGESELQGIDIAGVVKIATVTTMAQATTNGVSASTKHDISVTGMTVGGQVATVDTAGLHLGSVTIPAGSALTALKPLFDGFGISAYVTKPSTETSAGAVARVDSGALVVIWNPPGSTQYFTVVLGGNAANVRATTAAALPAAPTTNDDFFVPAASDSVLPTPSFSPSVDANVALSPSTAPPVALPSVANTTPIQRGPSFDNAVAVSDHVPAGWVVIGIATAFLLGLGLQNIRQRAIAAALAGTRCPLERS